MNVGESQRFDYTGTIQRFIVPNAGIYKLDVYGASGGITNWSKGVGNGGHSQGYIKLNKGTTLYIVVGGKGSVASQKNVRVNGGYNGGGSAISDMPYNDDASASGGGATHIALVDGLLADIGFTNFVTNRKGLIIAPGGGGATYSNYGGAGGGLSGGGANPGTQTMGYAFGMGGASAYRCSGGGGAGLYGGYGGSASGAGSGGSAYLGGVPAFKEYAPFTESGVNNGNGYAIIAFIAKSGGIRIGDAEYEIRLGDSEVEKRIGDMEVGA